ncbi:MAG: hypothetical protein GY833_16580 [Aestuariibacter sp.]|nr:hypothetical protein [Aestuariibacter sp.]
MMHNLQLPTILIISAATSVFFVIGLLIRAHIHIRNLEDDNRRLHEQIEFQNRVYDMLEHSHDRLMKQVYGDDYQIFGGDE